MNFISPLLLSISSNLDNLTVATTCKSSKNTLTKCSIIFISIITSLTTFISMSIVKVIELLFDKNLFNIFGCVLLILIGVYFIVEYIRLGKKMRGEDTSYYVESTSKYTEILENPNITNINKADTIDLNETLTLSFALAKNNIQIAFAAGIIGVSIPLSIFFNFIISIISMYICYFINNKSFSKSSYKYCTLASGIIVIIIGIYEIFI